MAAMPPGRSGESACGRTPRPTYGSSCWPGPAPPPTRADPRCWLRPVWIWESPTAPLGDPDSRVRLTHPPRHDRPPTPKPELTRMRDRRRGLGGVRDLRVTSLACGSSGASPGCCWLRPAQPRPGLTCARRRGEPRLGADGGRLDHAGHEHHRPGRIRSGYDLTFDSGSCRRLIVTSCKPIPNALYVIRANPGMDAIVIMTGYNDWKVGDAVEAIMAEAARQGVSVRRVAHLPHRHRRGGSEAHRHLRRCSASTTRSWPPRHRCTPR